MELDAVPQEMIEMSGPTGRSLPGVIFHRLQPGDQPRSGTFGGFRATNVDRTLLDLFAVLSPPAAELALEDALRRRLTTIDRLWSTLGAHARPGRNGVRSLRRCLLEHDDRDGALQSRMEAGLRRIVAEIPPPMAVPQYCVPCGEREYRLDFAFPHIKLGIEAHSLRWHMGRERWVRDLQRDRRLKLAGWTLLYFSWDDMKLDPNGVRREIEEARRDLESRLFHETATI